jgi:hypothetical protein
LVKLPERTTQTGKFSQVVGKQFMRSWQRIVVEHELYLESPTFRDGDSTTGHICIGFNSNDLNGGICAGRGPGLTAVGVDGPPFPVDTWIHCRYDVDPATKQATIDLGPVHLVTPFDLTPPNGDQRVTVSLGVLGYNVPAPAFAAHFDNVTIDFK